MGGLQDRWGYQAEEVVLSAHEQRVIAELVPEEPPEAVGLPEEN
ncbi:hypothetical protein [Streptomyces yaizuensis]|uniref:Uncharacterized protein n=1 Tax=Streptomyces yaizuensis TaxID=2989713 RepID=A0ABQ5NRK2_9ACTN|nr:hypothetical protein [Streptomyces sp. YSPA8]GLF92997.1 hypothetical protein SYYSPA8_01890 [Streptomyces sp. YSPA8]